MNTENGTILKISPTVCRNYTQLKTIVSYCNYYSTLTSLFSLLVSCWPRNDFTNNLVDSLTSLANSLKPVMVWTTPSHSLLSNGGFFILSCSSSCKEICLFSFFLSTAFSISDFVPPSALKCSLLWKHLLLTTNRWCCLVLNLWHVTTASFRHFGTYLW